MSDTSDFEVEGDAPPNRAVYILALIFVFMGIVNSTPLIPGWDDMWRSLSGIEDLKTRSFKTEWFYPIAFFFMMLVVALKHSMWREWRGTSRAWFGAFMDVALVISALAISLTYLIEIDSVCLIDAISGERARIMAETLKGEIELAEMMGLPIPDTVEDPKCVSTTGVWLVAIMGVSILVFLGYNIKVWGFPLVAVSIGIALYTIGTVLVWYFHGPEDINKYLMTKLGGEPRTFLDGVPNVHDALVNTASGVLGRFMNVIMNVVFPYIILGALFGKSAGGQTLIKLAFRLDTETAWRACACRDRFVRHVRHHHRRPGGERAVYWRSDDPDDAQARLFKSFCRGDGSCGFIRWIDHATGDGRRSIHPGRHDGRAVPRCDHRCRITRRRLLRLSLPQCFVPVAQTGN